MKTRIVFIPFPEAASFEHLLSTRGGNAKPETETILLAAQQKMEKHLAASQGLKNEDEQQAAAIYLQVLQKRYEKAEKDRDQLFMRGWNKIDTNDVVCSDGANLASAFRKLQNAKS